MINEKKMVFNLKNMITRSPRLETVIMVEKFIKERSGDFTKTQLFNNLPKKVMWGTFNVILSYLLESGKIGMDKNEVIVYIWNPELVKRFINRKGY